eukprot:CAMPEP_0197246672 /NCGR_PEP_ID=MMETSP1429-20130617/19594_1 /TAXON_ID=49237 /ORGANISM="Chaetoceros  sp., Strain UNC1202" /LENGTH=37 /DNA_ID= /DNA_START= /DNA_END= /DNA_ORIENTATION=
MTSSSATKKMGRKKPSAAGGEKDSQDVADFFAGLFND